MRVCAFDSGSPLLAIRFATCECVRLTAVRRFLLLGFQHASVRLTAVRRYMWKFVFGSGLLAASCCSFCSMRVCAFDSGLPLHVDLLFSTAFRRFLLFVDIGPPLLLPMRPCF